MNPGTLSIALATSMLAALASETRFDPSRYVRIFEDTGSGQRLLLYTAEHPRLSSRLMKADAESTLVVDVSRGLEGNGDIGLNKILMRAVLKKGNSTKPVEVIGYSQIGHSEESAASQAAFAFQTFDNIAGKLINLYFTSRDLIETAYSTECYEMMAMGEEVKAENLRTACPELAGRNERKVVARLELLAPEIQAVEAFFTAPENRTVTAELAARIFEIDIESLQAIAAQVKAERARLADPDASAQMTAHALKTILERTKFIVQDLSSLVFATGRILKAYEAMPADATFGKPAGDGFLWKMCPSALESALGQRRIRAPREFARGCYIEAQRQIYVTALRKYLVEGTIDLSRNDAESGDILILTVEAKGPDPASPGATAEFRIRVGDYGWKVGIGESLLFIKRIGVNEADGARPVSDPVKGLQPVRFTPFPGFNFGVTWFGRQQAAVAARGAAYGRLPVSNGLGDRLGRFLVPGLGVNVTFMTFGARRDFDPTAGPNGQGQFVTANGGSFEIGTGPVVTLFNNRLSATCGWNLMASQRRQYWGLGFGFITVGKDVARFLKKN